MPYKLTKLRKVDERTKMGRFFKQVRSRLVDQEESMTIDKSKKLSEGSLNWMKLNEKKYKEKYPLSYKSILENVAYLLDEALVKTVSSTGEIVKKKDRKTRTRLATFTTGLSKSERTQRARKASKTKKANIGSIRMATRKRKRALRKRKALGLQRNS